jgi:hypothetical protein
MRGSIADEGYAVRTSIAVRLQFRRAHAVARQRNVAGEHRVEFPPGTYRMRAWGARCAPFPSAA